MASSCSPDHNGRKIARVERWHALCSARSTCEVGLTRLESGGARGSSLRWQTRHLRHHHRRGGHGGVSAGQPAVRRPERARAAAGGGRQGQLSLDPHPRRLPLPDGQPARRLGLQDRRRARPQRPQPQLPARARARRLLVDQRHDLHARPGARLRHLAADGQPRLGLGGRAALFQAAPGPVGAGARRVRRPARARRRVAHRAGAHPLGDPGRVSRCGGGGRHPQGRGLQSRRQRGLRLFPRQPEDRHPLEHVQGLPAARAAPAQSDGRDACHGRAAGARRQARDGPGDAPAGAAAHRAGGARGDPGRRRHR